MKRKIKNPERDFQETEDLEQEERSETQEPEEIIESHLDLYNPENYQTPERHIQVQTY